MMEENPEDKEKREIGSNRPAARSRREGAMMARSGADNWAWGRLATCRRAGLLATCASAGAKWLVLVVCAGPVRGSEGSADTFFELKIRPVLAGKCFKCHGGEKVSNHLRVDSRKALLRGGESGPAIVPGEPEKSLLVQALSYTDENLKMPPDGRLPEEVAKDFARWIKQGAPWPRTPAPRNWQAGGGHHWAFEAVAKVVPPSDPTGWAANPVDCFIAARLRANGLHPVEPADRRTLIRRVTFDLIGLPPTPAEVEAFLADRSPNAYGRLVERLLASPRYGERWGRHWMDVARYADTAGDNADYPIPEIRLYRDYIIDAFNADKPYDRFVQEQLAGDILARRGPRDRYAERLVATGFLALSRRYATAPYEFWHLTMEDTIDTTGRAFLGLTLRCARCHDHKFDPVTKEDYYALYGFFASTKFPWAGAEEFASMKRPREQFVALLPPEEAAPRLRAYQARIQDLSTRMEQIQQGLNRRLAELDKHIAATALEIEDLEGNDQSAQAVQVERAVLGQQQAQIRQRLQRDLNDGRAALERLTRTGLPEDVPGAYAVQDGTPVDMYVHIRGEVEQHGPVVRRNVPRFLGGDKPLAIPPGASGRLELARWLTRPDHPLTSRVMVNRLWQHHFGKGLVATPSNFGRRGEAPTHPELLDWLARRFVGSGWSIKAMHRLMVLSNTYQQSSRAEDVAMARDPANRWYGRFERRRLDAEAIRDTLLVVSGRLDLSRPGPHPFPPVNQWVWTQHNPFKAVYPSNHRSVYLMTQRIQRHPFLGLFDGPDTNTTTGRRNSSTVPLQALFLMNNPFVKEQADGLAARLMGASADSRQRVGLAYQLALGRPAEATEMDRGVRYVGNYTEHLAKTGVAGSAAEAEAWGSLARVMLCANEFVYID
jgi:hypothetical protein